MKNNQIFSEIRPLKQILSDAFDTIHVSTVQLPIDHGRGNKALWFETMIFTANGQYQYRFETAQAAIKFHNHCVILVKNKIKNENEFVLEIKLFFKTGE